MRLYWLFHVTKRDTRTDVLSRLPWSFWLERQHPVTAWGMAETLCLDLGGPWNDCASELCVTFDLDGAPASVELTIGLKSKDELEAVLAECEAELDGLMCRTTKPWFDVFPATQHVPTAEGWWLTDDACKACLLALEGLKHPLVDRPFLVVARIYLDPPLHPEWVQRCEAGQAEAPEHPCPGAS